MHRWTNVAVEGSCKHGSASNKYPLSTFGNSETPLLPKILSLIETYCSSSLILSHRHSGTFTDMQLASAPKCLNRPNTALWFVKKKKLALPLWKTFLWRARRTAFQATNCTALANRSRPEKNIPNFSILTTRWEDDWDWGYLSLGNLQLISSNLLVHCRVLSSFMAKALFHFSSLKQELKSPRGDSLKQGSRMNVLKRG